MVCAHAAAQIVLLRPRTNCICENGHAIVQNGRGHARRLCDDG